MSFEKTFNPKSCEKKWYDFWEDHHLFKADSSSNKPSFSIVIPPPNVTGVLHIGHALVNTLQDILIRYKKMSGYETLWVPGTDHAGIATQSVVEASLNKEGLSRKDLGKEAFLDKAWEWKEKHEHVILSQFKKLGCSFDWSRLRFTMDEKCSLAVKTMFKDLFDRGLIYRGNYLVNWDPVTCTALADDEVEYEQKEGHLWYFRYPLANHEGFLTIATTRPETMLGDTAVAVSPKDPRYQHLIGQEVLLPLMERKIPIIADRHVDPEFGTGAVKITPAHDPNDYRMGLDHDLPFINIMTEKGFINASGGAFEGLSREECRKAVVQSMQDLNLLEKIEPHTHRIGVSYRSKAVIEPMLSKQWFVKMEPFIPLLRKAVETDQVMLIPSQWKQTYFHWIDHLRDWCISRQLWWGHQIPVWYHKYDKTKMICSIETPQEVLDNPDAYEQDPDVLDTWFSSALWPLSVFGWPEQTKDLDKFYPTSVLVTGHDILFFWVARMIAFGLEATDQVPFSKVFLHGLIFGKSYFKFHEGKAHYLFGEEKERFDNGEPLPKGVFSKWEKVSKSKGNVINPLDMIDLYGTDAVRMTLSSIANQSPQIDLDKRRFEEWKNFANKVWNGARFVLMNLESLDPNALKQPLEEKTLSIWDQWILELYQKTAYEMNQSLENFFFEKASTLAYEFFWKDFCAHYVEIVKPILYGKQGDEKQREQTQKILVHVLVGSLLLLHPFAPFITEELLSMMKQMFDLGYCSSFDPLVQQTLTALTSTSCLTSSYPQGKQEANEQVLKDFKTLEQATYLIRQIRGEMKISPGAKIDVYFIHAPKFVEENHNVIKTLAKVEKAIFLHKDPQLAFSTLSSLDEMQIIVPLPQELIEVEKNRLKKEKEHLEKQLERLNQMLSNDEFLQKAKPLFVEEQKKKQDAFKKELEQIDQKLSIS